MCRLWSPGLTPTKPEGGYSVWRQYIPPNTDNNLQYYIKTKTTIDIFTTEKTSDHIFQGLSNFLRLIPPDTVKEKSGTQCKENLENIQPTAVLLVERTEHSTASVY
jgi:hypothetical protein